MVSRQLVVETWYMPPAITKKVNESRGIYKESSHRISQRSGRHDSLHYCRRQTHLRRVARQYPE